MRTLCAALLFSVLVAGLWTWLARNQPRDAANSVHPPHVGEQNEKSVNALDAVRMDPAPTGTRMQSLPVLDLPAPVVAPIPLALVKVLVIDAKTREPLPGVSVRSWCRECAREPGNRPASSSHGKPFDELTTDEGGRAEIELRAGFALSVTADDRVEGGRSDDAVVAPLPAGTTSDIVLELSHDHDMQCWMQVVDAQTALPIQQAHVRTANKDDANKIQTSDARGLVMIVSRAQHASHAWVDATGYSTAYVTTETGHDREETALRVLLSRTATLRICVKDSTGAGVEDAMVELEYQGAPDRIREQSMLGNQAVKETRSGITDHLGRTVITNLPPGRRLRARVDKPREWTLSRPLVLAAGEVRDVEWTITGGCLLRGSLLDQRGLPVTHRKIWLRASSRNAATYFRASRIEETHATTTDSQGRFSFPSVEPGAWWVGPADLQRVDDPPEEEHTDATQDVAPFAQIVHIEDDQTTVDVCLRVDRGLFLRGQVVDSSGKPARSPYVSAFEPTLALHMGSIGNDVAGGFTIGPLMSGQYTLVASGNEGDAKSEPLVAEAGASDLVLHLRPGAAMTGQVVSEDGTGLPAALNVSAHLAPILQLHQMHTDGHGHFLLQGLLPGTFDVVATTADGRIGVLDQVVISAGTSANALIVHVSSGGRIRVRSQGPERGAEITMLQGGAIIAWDQIGAQLWNELTVPCGRITVLVRYFEIEPRTVERTIDVVAGATVDLVLESGAH